RQVHGRAGAPQLGATTLSSPVSEDPHPVPSMNQRKIQHRAPNVEHRMAARILAPFGVHCSMLVVRCFPSAQGFQRANVHYFCAFCPCLPLNSLVTSTGYKIVRLANGVHSVHSLAHRETFHPVIGPVAEAEALYVRQLRLVERLRGHAGDFVIWDVGLGAAANAITVLRATRGVSCPIRMLSFDQTIEPLQFALNHAESLGYFDGYESHLQEIVRKHSVNFHDADHDVTWELQLGDFPAVLARLLSQLPARSFPAPHAILFDAFSPAKNPAMWTLPLFANL